MANGKIRNMSEFKLAAYGPRKPGDMRDNSIYIMEPGSDSPRNQDFDGVYIPCDVKIKILAPNVHLEVEGPIAYKIHNLRTLIIAGTRREGNVYLANGSPDALYQSGQVNWEVPNWSQSEIDAKDADIT